MNPLLLELQNLDLHLQKCRRERSRLDDGTASRASRDECRDLLESQRKELASANAKRAAFEEEQKTVETKIARQQSRLMNAANAHEVTSFQRDIEGLNRRRSELDEEILMAMDEVDTLENTVAQTQKQLQELESQTKQIEENFRVQTLRWNNDEAETQTKRNSVNAELDEASRAKYEQFAKKFGGVAVVHPVSGNCSACGMEFTPYNLREAKKEEWPTCENCNRLLVL